MSIIGHLYRLDRADTETRNTMIMTDCKAL